jgi:uncharacterized protein YcfL
MKKLLFLACLMAGMLVSCSSDLIDSEDDQGSLYNEENVPEDGISFSFRLLNEKEKSRQSLIKRKTSCLISLSSTTAIQR